jgi:hypothetical protein
MHVDVMRSALEEGYAGCDSDANKVLTATTSRSQKQQGQAAKLSRSIQTDPGFCAK